ncbi:MAG: NAD(P)/FAD-dependent oxidoreductase [Candidatus Thorarchaeota archaeon]|nr:MAG: NAD(P)/FAD-dependent oxidoreductase [Candidatus Thorarchaeota archaeon]
MAKIGIIGNGVAGTGAIREIRKLDSEVDIDVFSDERHPYYPKPNLMDFVGGSRTLEEIIRYGPEWYENLNANLHLSTPVTQVDPGIKALSTPSGIFSGYDSLLIAVGSYPFVPPFEGVEKKNVHILRTIDDAVDICRAVKGAGREIIVGGGILGIELAVAIKQTGGQPIVVTNVDRLLPIQLDGGASEVLIRHLDRMEVETLLGFTCTGMTGDELATGVKSTAGDIVEGDLIVVATGVRSNVELARSSNLSVERGIVVDDFMQTSAEGIFAAGDCAEWNGNWYGIIPWALSTAKTAAQNMIEFGSSRFNGIIPSNTLQVAGIDLTSIGVVHVESPDYEQIVSVDRKEGTYYKAVIKDNLVVGGIALGNRKVALKLRTLISQQTDVSEMKPTLFELE